MALDKYVAMHPTNPNAVEFQRRRISTWRAGKEAGSALQQALAMTSPTSGKDVDASQEE
jgi:hypothetical protein